MVVNHGHYTRIYIIRQPNRIFGTPMGVTHGLSRIRLPNLVGTPMGATHGHYKIRLPNRVLGTPMGVTHGHYSVNPTYSGDTNGGYPKVIISSTRLIAGTSRGFTQWASQKKDQVFTCPRSISFFAPTSFSCVHVAKLSVSSSVLFLIASPFTNLHTCSIFVQVSYQ